VTSIAYIISKAPDHNNKTTLGEELWRVHLSRQSEVSADDFDHEAPHHPHRSVGEELWEVHCKRSRGNLDEDYPPAPAPEEDEDLSHATKQKRANHPKKPAAAAVKTRNQDTKVIELRNRKVKVAQ